MYNITNRFILGDKIMNFNDIKLYLENNLPFFDKLSYDEKEELVNNSSITSFSKGEIIYSKNSNCVGIVLVLSGQLRSFMSSNNGGEITIFRLFERDVCVLSSSCVYKNLTYDINLESFEDSKVLIIEGSLFKNLLYNNLYVKDFIINLMQDKLSEVMWVLEQIVFFSLENRLANFLLNEYYLSNSLDIIITHEYIANNLGLSREVISRILKRFEKEGILKISRGKLTITDLKTLKKLREVN